MKMKELLLYAKTWMNLTNIMLSKRIQAQKIIYCMVPSKLKHKLIYAVLSQKGSYFGRAGKGQ